MRYTRVMNHKFRFFFFLAACISFLCITTGVLLYVYGYRFSFERGIFIYSGSITVKPTPEEVSIFIDGEEVPKSKAGILNQSYLISGLLPGKHFLEVKADNYHSWSKDVIVQSGISTEFWNVFLVEQNIQKNDLKGSEDTRQMYPAPEDTDLMILAQENNDGVKVVLANTEEGDEEEETIATFPGYRLLPQGSKENIEWSPNEQYLLVPLLKNGQRDTAYVHLDEEEEPTLLSSITGKMNITNLRWNPRERRQFFYREGNTLIQTNIKDEELEYITRFENILAYDLSQDFLFYLKTDGFVYRIPLSATNENSAVQITRSPLPLSETDKMTMIAYNQTRLTLQNETRGELWLYNRFGSEVFFERILSADAKGAQFSNDGKKLLYFTDSQAYIYYLRDWKVQPIRNRGDIQPLIRLANNLAFPQWSFDYEHVLYVADGRVKIIELDNREAQYIQDVVSFEHPLLQVLPRFSENRLYFLLAPPVERSKVQSIEFPKEEPGIFENFIQ